MRRATA